jgi:hypothetical protein
MEVDWLTRLIAIYGAILATFTQVSHLWKDRVKIRVSAYYETTTDAGVTRITSWIVRATNAGRRTVTVKGAFVYEGKEKRFITANTKRLSMLEPTQEIDLRHDPKLVTDRTTRLGVFDTDGREWTLPRKRLNNLKRSAYQQESE